MSRRTGESMGELIVRSEMALGILQVQLAKMLGVSSKTVYRWTSGNPRLPPLMLVTLVRAVHEKEPALAARIAALHGETLVGLGVVSHSPSPIEPPPPRDLGAERRLADALVCAAAEVADISPRLMRPALAAALGRAREAGLSLDAAHALFAEPPPAPPVASTPSRPPRPKGG